MTYSLAVLTTALLFGGMMLYSFGFAALLFSVLPKQTAGATLRRAFPLFYVFVMATAAVAALAWLSHDITAAMVMAGIVLSTLPVRQLLMPAINHATDTGRRQRFNWLHGLSVSITIIHIVATGWLLVRLG